MNNNHQPGSPIKAVFLDIDGTLLNPEHEVTEMNQRVIRNLVLHTDIKTFLISARPPAGIDPFYKALNMDTPFSAYNGALIGKDLEARSFTVMQNYSLPYSGIPDLVSTSKHFDFSLLIYQGNTIYVESLTDEHALREERLTHCDLLLLNLDAQYSLWVKQNSGPHKIQLIGTADKINPFLEELTKKDYFSDLHIIKSGDLNYEITSNRARKEKAVEYLMQEYKIPLSQVMAIGDSYNDVETLKMVGFGVAMGNASEEILSTIPIHTKKNTESGVAYAILNHFPELDS